MPGGALAVIEQGVLEGVPRILALHCEPRIDVGTDRHPDRRHHLGLGHHQDQLSGRGGHTSRPHLTEDLVFALAEIAVNVPAVLNRRIDVRSRPSPWSGARSTPAPPPTPFPASGYMAGTMRCLDARGLASGRGTAGRGRPPGGRAVRRATCTWNTSAACRPVVNTEPRPT